MPSGQRPRNRLLQALPKADYEAHCASNLDLLSVGINLSLRPISKGDLSGLIFELVEGLRHQRKTETMAFNYFCFAIRPTTATSLRTPSDIRGECHGR
jgi:hypothetical protein